MRAGLGLMAALLAAGLAPLTQAATNTWIGAGDGNWNDPANWSGGVPTASDDAVLGPGGTVTISGGGFTVRSVQSERPISLSGASLTVTAGASEIKGALTMALATAFAVSGAGTTFLATNTVDADGASFYASGGAQIRLPGLRNFSKPSGCYGVNWQATGIGSVLDMSGVTNLSGGDCFYFNLVAVSGGQVVVSHLATMSNGYFAANADGAGSVVDLRRLASFSSADRLLDLTAQNGGQVIVPSLVDAGRTRLTLRNGGVMDTAQFTRLVGVTVDNVVLSLPAVTNVDQASLYVENGGRLTLPLVTSAIKSDGCYGVDWQATGVGSVLDMSAVTNLYGGDCFYVNLRAISGGLVVVSNLVTITNGYVAAYADGAGSVVDLRKLANFPSVDDRLLDLTAQNGGQVIVPMLVDGRRTRVMLRNGGVMDTTQLRRVIGVTVDNMVLSLPAVTNVDQASLYVENGGRLSLPLVTSVIKSDGCYGVDWQATGLGSVLDMSAVTNLYGGNCFYVNLRALSGGLVVVSNLVTITNGYVAAYADGAGSVVDLRRLANFPSVDDRLLDLTAQNGGQVIVPMLVDGRRTRVTLRNGGLMDTAQFTRLVGVTVDNVVLSLPAVTNVDQASLYVENGGRLTLPLVTSVIKSDGCYGVNWQATGVGSVLDMSAVTNLYGGDCFYVNLRALSGGLVVVSNLVTITNGYVAAYADGAGSVVDLRKQANYPSADRVLDLEARNSGRIIVPSLVDSGRTRVTLRNGGLMDTAQLRRVIGVTVDNAVLSLSAVTNVDQASLYVENGGRLSLPLVTSAIKPDGCYGVNWQATGVGSVLDMSAVTNLYGGDCFPFHLQAVSGGQLVLSNLANIHGYDIVVLADGGGSVVDLSQLTYFFASAAVSSSLTATNSGVVLFNPQAFVMVNVGVNIPPGNPVLPPISISAPNIVVRGTPWHSYLLEQRSSLSPDAPWQFFSRVPLTNYFQKAFGKPPANTDFRVTEFIADPPILELSLLPAHQAQLLLYGTTTNTYQIESATTLIAPVTWTPGDLATMTNAFRFFPSASAIEPSRFFRAKKL